MTPEKPITISIEEAILTPLKSFFSVFDVVLKRRFANNLIRTYSLTGSTDRTPLRFQNDTSNQPINKIEVLGIGGGLWLWLNGNDGFSVTTGQILEDIEITTLEYKVTSGTATILTYARVN